MEELFSKEQNNNIVQNNLANKGRRFLSILADIFILLICSEVFYFFVTFNLTKMTPAYKNAQTTSSECIKTVENLYYDSHLILKNSQGTAQEASETVNTYIKNKLFKLDYDDSGNYLDTFYYFYVNFIKNEPVKGDTLNYTIQDINVNIFKFNEPQDSPAIWNFEDINSPVHLTEESIEMISKYLAGEITAENESYYIKLKIFVQNNLVNAEQILKSTDKYTSSFSSINTNNNVISISITIGATLTFLLFFILLNIVVPLLFKNGQTLGKKVLRLALSDENGNQIKAKDYILRECIELVLFSCLCVLIPYLLLGIDCLYLPLIIAGSFRFDLSIYCLIVLIFALISLIYMFVSKDGQTMQDKALRMYCLDLSKDERLIKKKENGGN